MNKNHYPYLALFVFFAAFLVFSIGCETLADRAAAYNDAIMYHQVRMAEAFNDLDASLNNLESEAMQANYEILKGRIQEGKRGLEQLGSFDKDDAFQQAALGLFRSYDQVSDRHYSTLLQHLLLPDSLFTPAIQEAAFAEERAIYEEMKRAHEAFEEAQKSFGERYNLEFVKP